MAHVLNLGEGEFLVVRKTGRTAELPGMGPQAVAEVAAENGGPAVWVYEKDLAPIVGPETTE